MWPIVVVLFDIVGSTASRVLGFPYASLAPVSYAIYMAAGYFGARAGSILFAAEVAGATGFTEATVGWAASWVIGPGRVVGGYPGHVQVVVVIFVATLTAALVGLVGAGIARLVSVRRSTKEG